MLWLLQSYYKRNSACKKFLLAVGVNCPELFALWHSVSLCSIEQGFFGVNGDNWGQCVFLPSNLYFIYILHDLKRKGGGHYFPVSDRLMHSGPMMGNSLNAEDSPAWLYDRYVKDITWIFEQI